MITFTPKRQHVISVQVRLLIMASLPGFSIALCHAQAITQTTATAAPLNPQSYFGINGVGYFHHPEDAKENARRFELLAELGVHWDRSDFDWKTMEPQPGQWDYTLPDAATKAYRDHGVQIFPILDYGAAWMNGRAPANDAECDQFANFAANVIARYHDTISYWEVWNEPNILPFWRPQPDAEMYANLLRATYARAHVANPEVKIVGFATADLDKEFIERVLELAGSSCFDAVSYHFYRHSEPEERTPDEINELKLILRHFGRSHVPIWVTEMGVSSHLSSEGVSEDLQAIYLMRQILLCIAGGAERVLPFCLVDNAWDPAGPWGSQLGMVTLDWRKKPVFFAYKTIIAELQDYKLVGPVDLGEHVFAYLFALRKGARGAVQHKLVAWTTHDVSDIRISVDDIPITVPQPGVVEALTSIPAQLKNYTTLLGEAHPLEFDGATARVMLSPAPVYIPVKNATLVHNAQSGFEPDPIAAAPGQQIESTLHLLGFDLLSDVSLKSDWQTTWTASDAEHVKVQLEIPADVTPGWHSVTATAAGAAATFSKTLHVWVREPVRVQVRPIATTATQQIITSFVVHHTAVAQPLRFQFTCDPPLPGIELPSGELASARDSPGRPSDFVQQFRVAIPRFLITNLDQNLTIRFRASPERLLAQSGSFSRAAYRIGVLPLTDSPISIDGDLAEFAAAPKMLLKDPSQIVEADGGKSKPSASIGGLWRSDGLYLGCEITDDHPMMNNRGAGSDVYKGDGVEVYLCPRGYWGQYYATRENGAFHFALSPGRGGVGALVSDFEKEVQGSRISTSRTPTGYIMEAFIPSAAFGNYQPHHGDIIGWDLQLNDCDDYAPQARQTALIWNGDNMNWLRAGKWGMALIR